MIRYVTDDGSVAHDRYPYEEGPVVIAHVVNDVGAYGKGFAAAIRARYPLAYGQYRRWFETKWFGERLHPERFSRQLPVLIHVPFELGQIQVVRIRPNQHESRDDVWIANMLAQHGLPSKHNPTPLHLEALAQCLAGLSDWVTGHNAAGAAPGMRVQMPRIGTGYGGRDWSQIEPLVTQVPRVTVYDQPGQ